MIYNAQIGALAVRWHASNTVINESGTPANLISQVQSGRNGIPVILIDIPTIMIGISITMTATPDRHAWPECHSQWNSCLFVWHSRIPSHYECTKSGIAAICMASWTF